MPLKKLKTLSTRSLHKNPYWEYKLDRYALPGGETGEYSYVHSGGSVMVVPVDRDGRMILVKQFRYLWHKESVEFPGGGVKGNDFIQTAIDELAEEAGVAASKLEPVGEYNPYNGVSDEVSKVYFASMLSKAGKKRDASEEFEVIKLTSLEFQEMIDVGEIWDGMTLAAWSLAKRRVFNYLKETAE